MQQADLNRAVARATGETVASVKRLGFLLDDFPEPLDPEDERLGPRVLDWDDVPRPRRHLAEAAFA